VYEYRARVRSVYDGDTIRADIDCGFGIWTANQSLRLLGIDAPELGKPGGKESRDYLRGLLPVGTAVTIRTVKDETEKYGRLLATIWDRDGAYGDSVNDFMVTSGHAKPYDGGAR
jgi:micrococcal nuclease